MEVTIPPHIDPTHYPRVMEVSEEWKIQEFARIDEMLRCAICGNYVKTAMVIPDCWHYYCSLCIRQSLDYHRHCPSCRKSVNVSDIRNFRLLDEMVAAFLAMQPRLSQLIEGLSKAPTQDVSLQTEEVAEEVPSTAIAAGEKKTSSNNNSRSVSTKSPSRSPSRRSLRSHPQLAETPPAKRRRSSRLHAQITSEEEVAASVEEPPGKEEKELELEKEEKNEPVHGSEKEVSVETPIVDPPKKVGQDDFDDDFVDSSRRTTTTAASSSSSLPSSQSVTPTTSRYFGQCPICFQSVVKSTLQGHVERCLENSSGDNATSSAAAKMNGNASASASQSGGPKNDPDVSCISDVSPSQNGGTMSIRPSALSHQSLQTPGGVIRKPIMGYKFLKDDKLKALLKRDCLSVVGARPDLIRRHRQFTVLFNSYLDSGSPRSEQQVAAEVEADARKVKQSESMTKLESTEAFSKSARDVAGFSALLAETRQRKLQQKQAQQPPNLAELGMKTPSSTGENGEIKKEEEAHEVKEEERSQERSLFHPNTNGGTWRVIFSEKVQRDFYYNCEQTFGTFTKPKNFHV